MPDLRIVKRVGMLCAQCESDLTQPGFIRTVNEQLFFYGYCPKCEDWMTVEINVIIAHLYEAPMAPEPKMKQ